MSDEGRAASGRPLVPYGSAAQRMFRRLTEAVRARALRVKLARCDMRPRMSRDAC